MCEKSILFDHWEANIVAKLQLMTDTPLVKQPTSRRVPYCEYNVMGNPMVTCRQLYLMMEYYLLPRTNWSESTAHWCGRSIRMTRLCGVLLFPMHLYTTPDSKVPGANMGPIWGRQDPGELHVGPMNFAIWDNRRGFFVSFEWKLKQFDSDVSSSSQRPHPT